MLLQDQNNNNHTNSNTNNNTTNDNKSNLHQTLLILFAIITIILAFTKLLSSLSLCIVECVIGILLLLGGIF